MNFNNFSPDKTILNTISNEVNIFCILARLAQTGLACVLLYCYPALCYPALIEGRSANVAVNENIKVIAVFKPLERTRLSVRNM